MQICKCKLLKMCTVLGWDRSKSNAFFWFEPPREIRQANLWKYRVFASHQRRLIPDSFNFHQRGTFNHMLYSVASSPSPVVCSSELWRCLEVHIMLCPSLAAGCCCCGLTRRVNRADALQPLLPDTLLGNVNEVGQTRLEWTLGSLSLFWSFSFSLTFSPAVSQHIYGSWCFSLSSLLFVVNLKANYAV